MASETTYEAALLAAGTAIEAALARRLRARAPARPSRACASARWASASSTTSRSPRAWRSGELGIERVAIVDFDVHHGNGTQAIFRGRRHRALRVAAPVAVLSRHRRPRRPGRDDAQRPAAGRARATREYLRAFEQTVEPAVARFEPELVLVSAGFDAHEDDPLAEMRVTEDGFRELAQRCAALGPARRRRARGRLRARDAAAASSRRRSRVSVRGSGGLVLSQGRHPPDPPVRKGPSRGPLRCRCHDPPRLIPRSHEEGLVS